MVKKMIINFVLSKGIDLVIDILLALIERNGVTEGEKIFHELLTILDQRDESNIKRV